MKILKVYIENFGCLHQYTKVFDENITVIEEENGFGKTTLANFIKAMFYGFSGLKKNINENDRLKYAPWQGGLFGGYLDFELNGKEYRIERFFNPIGSTKDTFKLIDLKTNKVSKDYTKNIGEEIFGIDVESYIRSSYLPQSNIEWSSQKISDNLTKMLESSSDIYDVSEALKKLEAEMKKYVKTGNKGLIAETEAKIIKLEESIEIADLSKENTKVLKDKLNKINILLEENSQKLSKIKEQIKLANEQHKKEAIFSHYQTISQNKEKIKRELDLIVEFFKDNFPTKDQISHNYNLLEQLSIIQSNLNKLTSNDYIESEYQRLNNYFDVDQEINEEILKDKFKENEELKRISIERERISKELEVVENKLANDTLLTQKHKMIYILLAFFSLILDISGIVMIISTFKDFSAFILVLGIILALAGLVFGIISLSIFITRINKDHQVLIKYKKLEEECGNEKQALSQRYLELEEKFIKINNSLKTFVSKYEKINDSLINRIKSDEDYLIELNNISQSYKSYSKLQAEYYLRKEKLAKANEDYNLIKEELNKFTKFYLPNEEPFQALRKIQLSFDQYESLNARYLNACKELTTFLENNDVEEHHTQNIYNLSELEKDEINLEKTIDDLIKEKYSTENAIRNDESKIDNLFEIETQLSNEKDLLVEYKNKYYILTKTIEFLKESQDKLATNYLGTIKERFSKYVEKALNKKTNFDLSVDLEITSEEFGSIKELNYFSAGYHDIVTFCARLALIDALFKDVKPTIILDDPFTNLDKNKLNVALELVKEIANKYQVVYLICHESRKLGE